MLRSISLLVPTLAALSVPTAAQDSDGDGLSDFHERHKYLTDPSAADSDGDGLADGEWSERREYTYTIRSIVRVVPPCGRDLSDDNYQDARVLEDSAAYVELEVVHYPLSTAHDAITGDPKWRRNAAKLREFTRPRTNANWDAKMRRDLIAELKAAQIDVATLDDKQIVERVSQWFVETYDGKPWFNALHVHYPEGKIEVVPGHEALLDLADGWTPAQQFEHELLGREMYYHKTRGTCTSSALALMTVLRAIGIPSRMVLAIPLVDASDPAQRQRVEKRIHNHRIREAVLEGLSKLEDSFASHTYNEVFVGGRWHRLNYSRLGQPTLDRQMFGLLTHVLTFTDLSDWGLQPTWGDWAAAGRRTYVFGHRNPYAAIALSDRFGEHAEISNPGVRELRALTISKLYWFHSVERPAWIKDHEAPRDGSGHLLAHVDEDLSEVPELGEIYDELDKRFVLKARGKADVAVLARRGYWASEFYLHIDDRTYERMSRRVPYALFALNTGDGPRWKITPGVTITKN